MEYISFTAITAKNTPKHFFKIVTSIWIEILLILPITYKIFHLSYNNYYIEIRSRLYEKR